MPPPPFDTLAAFAANSPLNDASLPATPVSLNLPGRSIPIAVPALAPGAPALGQFTLAVGAATSIAIINATSDPDPVGYFGLGTTPAPAAEDPDDGPLAEAPATFDPTQAYIVMTGLAVTGKLSGQMTIGTSAALGLDGSGVLDASVCYAFPASTPVWDAAPALLSFPSLFSLADLQAPVPAPGPGAYTSRILSFGVQGRLAATLKLTAPSLASTIADAVNSVLSHVGPVKFDSSVGATIAFSACVADGYRIFAWRAAQGVTFCVKKSTATSVGASAGLGLDVTVSLPELNQLINSAVEQVTQVAGGSIASVLGTPLAALSSAQQQILATILAKLGLPATVGDAQQTLAKTMSEFADQVRQKLQTVVTAQFSYEWKRLTSDAVVARFTVADAALPAYHPAILTLQLDRLLAAPASEVTFERFLGRKTTELDVGFGFSFGISGHVFLRSWSSLRTKFVELQTRNPGGGLLRQFSFLGKRGFVGSWFDRSQSNYAEIDASMPDPLVSPTAADFTAGISIGFTWSNQRFADILSIVADHGVVVGAFATSDVNAARDSLVAAGVDPNAAGDAVVSLKVGCLALNRLLLTLAGPAYASQVAPYALARALPYHPDFIERTDVKRRMLVYAQAWADYLATEDVTVPMLETICRNALTQNPTVTKNLILRETSSEPWTMRRIGDMEGINALQHAVNHTAPIAFDLLRRRAGDFRSLFPQCVASLEPLARDTFGCRTLAGMLLVAAKVTPGGSADIERAVSLTWTDKDGAHAVAIKPATSLLL